MSQVKNKLDFMQWLGPDLSMKILTHLDDPCDLIRVSTLSRSWHKFVIEYGLFKQLCLKKFPEISAHSAVAHTIEVDNMVEPVSDMLGSSSNWECLKRNHRVNAFLASGLSPISKNCIAKAQSASSTDNYPEHGEMNTLDPRDRTHLGASYWSSKGESDPSVAEALMYKLASKICLVTEVHVQPFQAYFQPGQPIYSAKAVRFRIGCPKEPYEIEGAIIYLDMLESRILGDEYWTYTSPEFPMLQENCLQIFKLPEPVLCIGGILQVELLGRVQKQERDQLFYLRVCHVKVVGRLLLPPFDVRLYQPSGKCTLNYCPETDNCMSLRGGNLSCPSRWRLEAFTTDIQRSAMSMWEEVIMIRRLEREIGGR